MRAWLYVAVIRGEHMGICHGHHGSRDRHPFSDARWVGLLPAIVTALDRGLVLESLHCNNIRDGGFDTEQSGP